MQNPADWRLTSPGGIKHKLIRQWGNFGREDCSWHMEICIQAGDLAAFVGECFPEPVIVGGATIRYPRRFYPAGLPAMTCKNVNVEEFTTGRPIDPFGAGLSLYTAEEYAKTFEHYLRVTIDFGTCSWNSAEPDPADPFTYLEISASASGEFLTSEVNQDPVTWEDVDGDAEAADPTDTDLDKAVRATETEWTLKWPQIPFAFFYPILKPRLDAAMGMVNNAPMALFGNAPAETILFDGYDLAYEYTWRDGFSGVSPLQLSLRFVEKNFTGRQKNIGTAVTWQDVQVTHNHMYRPNHGWQRLLVDGEPIYQQYDLMRIFTG